MKTNITDISDPRVLRALEANWQAEMEGEATYRTFAGRESDPERKDKLTQLADSELGYANRWASRLNELGVPTPSYRGSPAGTANSLVNRVSGDHAALRRIELDDDTMSPNTASS